MTKNVVFHYLYRDAGNFKKWGEVVFSNTGHAEISELEAQLRGRLIDNEFFVPGDVDVPVLKFEDYVPSQDHDWHQFESLISTEANVSDRQQRDIETFVASLVRACGLR